MGTRIISTYHFPISEGGRRCHGRKTHIRFHFQAVNFIILLERSIGKLIVAKARRALKDTGGMLLIEPHIPGVIRANFESLSTWSAKTQGLFSDRPHLLLEEGYWHDDVQMAVKRWYVVDSESGEVALYSQTMVEHDPEALVQLVESQGFRVCEAPDGWPTGNEANRKATFF